MPPFRQKNKQITQLRFEYMLARDLGMLHGEMIQRMPATELAHWRAFYIAEGRERDAAAKGK